MSSLFPSISVLLQSHKDPNLKSEAIQTSDQQIHAILVSMVQCQAQLPHLPLLTVRPSWSFGAIHEDEALAMTDTGELYHFSFSLRQWRGPWRLGAKKGIGSVSWQGACSSSSGDWILVGITEANAQVWQLSRKALQVAAQVTTHVQIEHV